MPSILLFSTLGCHLCEQAEDVLHEVQQSHPDLNWQVIEIAESDDLMERYGIRIPVLRDPISGKELGWPFDASSVMSWLGEIG